MRRVISAGLAITLFTVPMMVFGQQGPTALVSYRLDEAVPVLGTGAMFMLGILLCMAAGIWLHRNRQSSLGKMAMAAMSVGVMTSVMSGGWLVSNAQAVIAATTFLLSENSSPVLVTEFPAELKNDLQKMAFITAVEVSGCPVDDNGSTCEAGLVLAGGQSCMLDYSCPVVADGSFTNCVGNWCLQADTLNQYTRCESASVDGLTCNNPEIRYGSVEGGIPSQHDGNNFPQWCQQLGFAGSSSVNYGLRSTDAPNGRLFGCTFYDENNWHWCDWQDGYWLNQSLEYHQSFGTEITSITCSNSD